MDLAEAITEITAVQEAAGSMPRTVSVLLSNTASCLPCDVTPVMNAAASDIVSAPISARNSLVSTCTERGRS